MIRYLVEYQCNQSRAETLYKRQAANTKEA